MTAATARARQAGLDPFSSPFHCVNPSLLTLDKRPSRQRGVIAGGLPPPPVTAHYTSVYAPFQSQNMARQSSRRSAASFGGTAANGSVSPTTHAVPTTFDAWEQYAVESVSPGTTNTSLVCTPSSSEHASGSDYGANGLSNSPLVVDEALEDHSAPGHAFTFQHPLFPMSDQPWHPPVPASSEAEERFDDGVLPAVTSASSMHAATAPAYQAEAWSEDPRLFVQSDDSLRIFATYNNLSPMPLPTNAAPGRSQAMDDMLPAQPFLHAPQHLGHMGWDQASSNTFQHPHDNTVFLEPQQVGIMSHQNLIYYPHEHPLAGDLREGNYVEQPRRTSPAQAPLQFIGAYGELQSAHVADSSIPAATSSQFVPSNAQTTTMHRRSPDSRSPQPAFDVELHPPTPKHKSPSPGKSSSTGTVKDRKVGGRPKGQPLDPSVRKRIGFMRKAVSCWRCALQRDQCDHQEICRRCAQHMQRGQILPFGCNRSKLPSFTTDFLPESMTHVSQKHNIEELVRAQVLDWDRENSIDIFISSGYGLPLRWTVFEFKPRTPEILSQWQYSVDQHTGMSRGVRHYAPPLALVGFDSRDNTRVAEYLDELLAEEYLHIFGEKFYALESMIDPFALQARMLQAMCTLYLDTTDVQLRDQLSEILRMLIITFIMTRTLSLEQDTVDDVLSSIKLSQIGQVQHQQHVSPRLAIRQIKYYFSEIRAVIYNKILKWLQQTLHTGHDKNVTWLPSFCTVLGVAMVLEEVEHTLYIQADAQVSEGEDPSQRYRQLREDCTRIDERFGFIVHIFQSKFRNRRWGTSGSFGTPSPTLEEPAAVQFLSYLYELVDKRADHLTRLSQGEVDDQGNCHFTGRLVSRFLIPFRQTG